MNTNENSSKFLAAELKDNESGFGIRLGRLIYKPVILALLAMMLGTIFAGLTLIVYDVESTTELPQWFDLVISNFVVPVGSFYNVYDAESSKHLNVVFLMLVGMVMAIFVRRCAIKENRFELYVVVSLLVFALLMIYVRSRLPAIHLAELIRHPEDVYHYIEVIVIRNCNLAAVIVAAALGANLDN